jgi:hypothetical protein
VAQLKQRILSGRAGSIATATAISGVEEGELEDGEVELDGEGEGDNYLKGDDQDGGMDIDVEEDEDEDENPYSDNSTTYL